MTFVIVRPIRRGFEKFRDRHECLGRVATRGLAGLSPSPRRGPQHFEQTTAAVDHAPAAPLEIDGGKRARGVDSDFKCRARSVTVAQLATEVWPPLSPARCVAPSSRASLQFSAQPRTGARRHASTAATHRSRAVTVNGSGDSKSRVTETVSSRTIANR